MSRSIRDLRDFISVSRLSFRGSDTEDGPHSSDDGEDASKICPRSVSGDNSDSELFASHQDNARNMHLFNSSSLLKSTSQANADDIVVGRPNSAVGMRRPPSRFAPHPPLPFPPSGKRCGEGIEEDQKDGSCSGKVTPNENECRNRSNTNDAINSQEINSFDEIFSFVDAAIISSWLEMSNKQLAGITSWLDQNHNFLRLAHFLLSDFQYTDRKQLFEMEVSIIIDEFQLAFRIGIDSKKVKLKDLMKLLSIVLREYPAKLLGHDGIPFILDVLCIFCSGKNENFKKLLSNVKYSTENKQIAQWILAMRAFSLIGLCNGIVDFFKGISDSQLDHGLTRHCCKMDALNRIQLWIFCSIEHGYLDVLEYFVKHAHCDVSRIVDDQGRNLIFKAVVYNEEKILSFLINKVSPKIDVNRCSSSGNSPLHAAISKGNFKIISVLVENGANINQCNPESQGATPLHLAVMNGDLTIVKLLVENGADTKTCMGNPATISPAGLARDFENKAVLQYLENC